MNKKNIILVFSFCLVVLTANVCLGQESRQVLLQSKVLFEFSESSLTKESTATLNEISALLNLYPNNKILIEGHSDSTGEKLFNQKLSEERANSVFEFLEASGISGGRMSVSGFGSLSPAATNDTAEGQRQNRRVEIKIMKISGQ